MEPKTGSFAKYTDKVIIADRRTFDRYLEKKRTDRRGNDKSSSSRAKKDKGKPQKEASSASKEPKKDKSKNDNPEYEDCLICQDFEVRACKYHPGQTASRIAIELGCQCHLDSQKYEMHTEDGQLRPNISSHGQLSPELCELPECTIHKKTPSVNPYDLLHFTACYQDDYLIHLRAKEDNDFWPGWNDETPTEPDDECRCTEIPRWPEYPRSCYLHPESERSQKVISQGCLCYSPMLCIQHELLDMGTPPSEIYLFDPMTREIRNKRVSQEENQILKPQCKYGKKTWFRCKNDQCTKHARPSKVRHRGAPIDKTLCEVTKGTRSQIEIPLRYKGKVLKAMIDSGAEGNFISPAAAEKHQIPWKYKLKSYKLRTVDGSLSTYENGRVLRETEELPVQIQGHQERVSLDIADISGHDIILGMPWLCSSNPRIDWKKRTLSWDEMPDKDDREICYVIKEVRVPDQIFTVPPEYQGFKRLFKDREDHELPPYG
ncbi:hypothetical protein DL762_006400 [Monosporascus cannonballus]|uniref:Peptidase A2 domain-containing protein n=1 Tax=Monosporascus cannonballus TaxID=155416 RepID=A0ABY0H2M6_9PEZI|nr:hypothetical protein DL762_006400 [Monosporascus cannonballus]